MKRSFVSLVYAAAAVAVLGAAEPAAACLFTCQPPVRTFGPDARVPGNLIYFKLLTDTPGPLALQTSEGQPIAASIRSIGSDRVFAPEQPVAEGTQLVLSYTALCPDGAPGDEGKYTFEAVGARAPQARPGGLEPIERGWTDVATAHPTPFLRVAYHHELWDWEPLVDFEVTIDGHRAYFDLDFSAKKVIKVLSACPRDDVREVVAIGSDGQPIDRSDEPSFDSCGLLYAVQPGEHIIEIAPRIVGAAEQPERVSLAITTDCEAPGSRSEPTRPEPSFGEEEQARPHVTAAIRQPAGQNSAQRGDGCSVAGGSAPDSLAPVLTALALLLRRRRRRAQVTCSRS